MSVCACGCDAEVRPGRKFRPGHNRRKTPSYTIAQDTGCWIWDGHLTSGGYGGLRERANGGRGRSVKAHRWYYEQLVGPAPEGLVLDHLCRNRACVNPAHLQLVSHKENILRGVGACARNASKTHCRWGHPLSEDNLRFTAQGHRVCVICHRRRNQRYRIRQRAA